MRDDDHIVFSAEVRASLQDPRFSSDLRKGYSQADQRIVDDPVQVSFITMDPPKHDWLRHQVMTHFTPELISGLRPRIEVRLFDR